MLSLKLPTYCTIFNIGFGSYQTANNTLYLPAFYINKILNYEIEDFVRDRMLIDDCSPEDQYEEDPALSSQPLHKEAK